MKICHKTINTKNEIQEYITANENPFAAKRLFGWNIGNVILSTSSSCSESGLTLIHIEPRDP